MSIMMKSKQDVYTPISIQDKANGWPIMINLRHNSIADKHNHTDYSLILSLICSLYYCHMSAYFNFDKDTDRINQLIVQIIRYILLNTCCWIHAAYCCNTNMYYNSLLKMVIG